MTNPSLYAKLRAAGHDSLANALEEVHRFMEKAAGECPPMVDTGTRSDVSETTPEIQSGESSFTSGGRYYSIEKNGTVWMNPPVHERFPIVTTPDSTRSTAADHTGSEPDQSPTLDIHTGSVERCSGNSTAEESSTLGSGSCIADNQPQRLRPESGTPEPAEYVSWCTSFEESVNPESAWSIAADARKSYESWIYGMLRANRLLDNLPPTIVIEAGSMARRLGLPCDPDQHCDTMWIQNYWRIGWIRMDNHLSAQWQEREKKRVLASAPVASASAYAEYIGYLIGLHAMIAKGTDETPEGEALRLKLDDAWKRLSPEEVRSARIASIKLNEIRTG